MEDNKTGRNLVWGKVNTVKFHGTLDSMHAEKLGKNDRDTIFYILLSHLLDTNIWIDNWSQTSTNSTLWFLYFWFCWLWMETHLDRGISKDRSTPNPNPVSDNWPQQYICRLFGLPCSTLVAGFQLSGRVTGRHTWPFSSIFGWYILVLKVTLGGLNGYSAGKSNCILNAALL